jgi:ketosteroid isomerase-like protein
MSQENVAIVRRVIEAVADADFSALTALCDPDIEFRPLAADVEGGRRYRGATAMRDWLQETAEVWSDFEISLHHLEGHGEWVIAQGATRWRARQSGMWVRGDWTLLGRCARGRLVEWTTHPDRPSALEAAGLSE